MRRYLTVSVVALFALSLSPSAMAAPTAYLSEVAWAGSSRSTADEWLELANAGAEPVDVSGWRIEGAAASNGALVIPAGSIVAPGATFLVANYGADNANTTLSTTPQWVTTAVALPNDHLHLVLRDASGAIVDEAGAGATAAPAGTTGTIKASMERVAPSVAGSDPTAWKTATTSLGFDSGASDLGTPGALPAEDATPTPEEPSAPVTETATSTEPTPVTHSSARRTPTSAVRLSELMPIVPKGETEWVELVNPSDIGELLNGWTLEDGRSVIARLDGLLQPWNRLVVASLSGNLNDDGDVVTLKDSSGRVVDAVAYGGWPKGSYASVPGTPKRGDTVARRELSNEWRVTSTPTKGEANVFDETPPEVPTTEKADVPPMMPVVQVKPIVQKPVVTSSTTTALVTASVAPVVPAPAPATPKKVAAAKPKAPAKSRYKGTAFSAKVAVPLGVYGKTRMIVNVEGALRELRLSSAPQEAPDAGASISFIAQDKSEGGASYLQANVKTLTRSDEAPDEPVFATAESWPTESGPVDLKATVVTADPHKVTVRAGTSEGVIAVPSTAKFDLKPGDEISVQGFVAPEGETPVLFLAAAGALSVLKRAAEASAAQRTRFPPWAAATLTASVLAVGVLAYLRNERLKRLSLVRREDELPLEE